MLQQWPEGYFLSDMCEGQASEAAHAEEPFNDGCLGTINLPSFFAVLFFSTEAKQLRNDLPEYPSSINEVRVM